MGCVHGRGGFDLSLIYSYFTRHIHNMLAFQRPQMVVFHRHMLLLCLHLLVWVLCTIILSKDNLPLLLRARMLDPYLPCPFRREVADESWVPELRRNAQVFTAAHQRVGFAALRGSGYAVWVEVLLLTTCDRNQSVA